MISRSGHTYPLYFNNFRTCHLLQHLLNHQIHSVNPYLLKRVYSSLFIARGSRNADVQGRYQPCSTTTTPHLRWAPGAMVSFSPIVTWTSWTKFPAMLESASTSQTSTSTTQRTTSMWSLSSTMASSTNFSRSTKPRSGSTASSCWERPVCSSAVTSPKTT